MNLQWTNESMSQWISGPMTNDSVSQWTSESMNQWVNMKQWVNEPIINEAVNQWSNEAMNQSINESLNPWINEAMNERMIGWMSELPLCWATSSLRDLLAQVPLSLSYSFSEHGCFPARSCANTFCHSRLQTRICQGCRAKSTNVCAPSTCGLFRVAPNAPVFLRYFPHMPGEDL